MEKRRKVRRPELYSVSSLSVATGISPELITAWFENLGIACAAGLSLSDVMMFLDAALLRADLNQASPAQIGTILDLIRVDQLNPLGVAWRKAVTESSPISPWTETHVFPD